MLNELYQYAKDHALAAQAGFQRKSIKAYVSLSAAGDFLGIIPLEKGTTVYAPDIGSSSNGTKFCNFLVEKAKIPLCIADEADKNVPTKHRFFLSMLDSGAAAEEKFSVLAQVLRCEEKRQAIAAGLMQSKLKLTDPIGFRIDGTPLEESEKYLAWWNEFRQMFIKTPTSDRVRCMINGTLTAPMSTVPVVKGLFAVGGHTKGDAFICFDKDAFQSYGLTQGANAPVSEEAMVVVNAALNDLIPKAPVYCGVKILHWYAGEVPQEADLLGSAMKGVWPLTDDEIDDLFDAADEAEAGQTSDKEKERAAMLQAKQLFRSLHRGEPGPVLTARYYVLPLSGVNGRVMPRGWFEGNLSELYRNLNLWFTDLQLVHASDVPSQWEVYRRLLKPSNSEDKLLERMKKELSSLSIQLLTAILQGSALPDEIAVRCLRYIRAIVLEKTEENKQKRRFETESLAFQLLKAWLVRRQRARKDAMTMGKDVTESPATPAYCCGRFMAIYAAIQKEAMQEVNVGVAERYYTAASTTPAFVLGKLAQLSIYHLAKLDADKPGRALQMRRMLEEVSLQLPPASIPRTLNLEEQTQFALGFYHQRAAIYAGSKEGGKSNGNQQ